MENRTPIPSSKVNWLVALTIVASVAILAAMAYLG